ncbi:unnamed protein product [Lactuca virosa]|uniref:Uncharacterized protein n=1 Tax=Lactuca virosa TaxID=75947 RepID=A0AAU9MVU3_9ASTR|nr:unnamed protein product [Lactuca virosa]
MQYFTDNMFKQLQHRWAYEFSGTKDKHDLTAQRSMFLKNMKIKWLILIFNQSLTRERWMLCVVSSMKVFFLVNSMEIDSQSHQGWIITADI